MRTRRLISILITLGLTLPNGIGGASSSPSPSLTSVTATQALVPGVLRIRFGSFTRATFFTAAFVGQFLVGQALAQRTERFIFPDLQASYSRPAQQISINTRLIRNDASRLPKALQQRVEQALTQLNRSNPETIASAFESYLNPHLFPEGYLTYAEWTGSTLRFTFFRVQTAVRLNVPFQQTTFPIQLVSAEWVGGPRLPGMLAYRPRGLPSVAAIIPSVYQEDIRKAETLYRHAQQIREASPQRIDQKRRSARSVLQAAWHVDDLNVLTILVEEFGSREAIGAFYEDSVKKHELIHAWIDEWKSAMGRKSLHPLTDEDAAYRGVLSVSDKPYLELLVLVPELASRTTDELTLQTKRRLFIALAQSYGIGLPNRPEQSLQPSDALRILLELRSKKIASNELRTFFADGLRAELGDSFQIPRFAIQTSQASPRSRNLLNAL